ncbi:MAG: alpha amylase C-terminal domain-containing protein [Aphanocapsa sp. GSE-SYN-MK-11-07L]|jgi:1,4-alpha-glucan branching enzyme|nr:alpha amylase C-terminal domain-containing protein [Aphanocapsa sp. GSE-SYN-MK-11-07L]
MTSPIEFKLFAPDNERAALIGSFSDWQEIPMQKSADGYFRTAVDLADGVYQYKFRVQSRSPDLAANPWVEITDPYATDVEGESKHENAIANVKDGERIVDAYVWQHDDQPLPANHELVIYEMHVADFSGGEIDPHKRGKYVDAIGKLDYLTELGINAIELMPVNEYPGDYSWGYKVRHFFATETSYGSTAELKQFIDTCHAKGIRVIMDGIFNHTDEQCPLMLIDRNYWYYEHMHYPEDPANHWGPEFNYDTYDQSLDLKPAWNYVGDVVRFWVQEYHIDGIRFDAVRQLANFEFLSWVANEAKQQVISFKPFYNIAEHIPDTHTVVEPNGPLDACWHESFRYFVVPHVCGETFDLDQLKQVLDPKQQGYATATNVINYLATHDRQRLLRELGDRGIFDEAAFRRAKLGAVLLLTAMGIPMIWMGEEFGEHKRKSETVTQPKKIAWPLLEQAQNRDLFEYYKGLIKLRQQSVALQSDNIEFCHENAEARILAYIRWQDRGNRVLVLVNFSDQSYADYQLTNLPEDGGWQAWDSNAQVEVTNGCLLTNLEGWSAKIFVWQ